MPWPERNFVAENSGPPDDLSLCALPLCLQDRCLGGIVLEVASVNVAFEGSDRQFLDALASEMAVALDRARLLERERERQKEEKERRRAEAHFHKAREAVDRLFTRAAHEMANHPGKE